MIGSSYFRLSPSMGVLLLLSLFAGIGGSRAARAEEKLRVVRANSAIVDIQDGNRLKKGVWTVQPSLKLDVYQADRTSQKKRITFRTDSDAISFEVEPGKEYDFVVLLKNKQRCRTRISTMLTGYRRIAKTPPAFDEIPFTIGADQKIHIQGSMNGSRPLDFLFDTGADAVVLYPSALAKGVRIRWDGTVSNSAFGGASEQQSSANNALTVAGLQWAHERILRAERQSDQADGVIGFNVFEDKVMEIDYERRVLRLRDRMGKTPEGYQKVETRNKGALMTIPATLHTGKTAVTDWFIVDTGANATLHLSYAFAKANQLLGTMEKIGSSRSGGIGAKWVENERVLLPELVIAGTPLPRLPIDIPIAEEGFEVTTTIGMEVLKHFNMILDFPHRQIYLKPVKRNSTAN